MDIKISKLYETFLYAQEVGFDYGVTFSLRSSLKLKEFLDDLDPELPLDWSAKSFYGMPELRQRVIETQDYHVPIENTLITAGTNEAIFLVLTQTISPGDEVVMDNRAGHRSMNFPGRTVRRLRWLNGERSWAGGLIWMN